MPGPLEGVRIIEMGQLIAIPFAMKMLADMGAQVIRLESVARLESYRSDSVYQNDISGDFWNKGANFYEQNRNKLGVTLDLSKPEGLQVLRNLVSIADVFSENFTPRVIKNFGLEYEDLRKIKPDIIMVSSTGYGFYGPWSNFGATGPATEGAAGLAYQTGYLGGGPVMAEIPYTDYTSGEHTVFAVMAALMHRLRTGQGQFVDISQTQATSSTIPEVLMDFSANGRSGQRFGNQDTVMSPHGCYPCRGDDRWITIAVATDEEWQAVCRVLGQNGWAADPRFEDSLSRWKNRDELDALIGTVTSTWDAHELMHALQKDGVAAGAVLDSKDLLFDPHLGQRNFYEVVTHHESTGIPPLPYAGRPWKLSKTPAVNSQPAPLMGEHNNLVLSGLLGKTAEEMAELEEAGIIGYGPTNPRPVQRPSLDEQVRQGRMQRYETDFGEQVRRAFPG
ncbi:MAG: CoA transferase [Dehalococcoidia bacterium]|nr:CoA transferase [Dehalococcoidia bacterium]